jgi:hypothetical protein
MAIEGSLDLFGMPEILQMIAQQGKTGILTVQGQQDIVAISFLSGWVVAADSLAHTVEEGLAKTLVSEGLLSTGEFARAAAENQAAGGRLVDFLVDRGYLSRERLLAALRLQTVGQLEPLLRWQEGDFKFYSGDEVSYEEGFEPISVEDLLLRSLADFGSFTGPAAGASPPAARPAPAGLPGAAPAGLPGAAAGAVALPPGPQISAAPAPARGASTQPDPAVGGSAPATPARPQPWPAGATQGFGNPGRATQVRGASNPAAPEPRELRLPQIPDLPEIAMPDLLPAPGAPAAAAAVPARSPRPLPTPPAARSSAAPAVSPAPPEPVPWPAAVVAPRPAVAGPPAASAAPRPAAASSPPATAAPRPTVASQLPAGMAPRPTAASPPPATTPPWPAVASSQPPFMAQRQTAASAMPASMAPRSAAAGSPLAAPAAGRPPGVAPGGARPLKLPAAAAPATPQAAAVAGVLVPPPGAVLPKKFRQMQLDRPVVPASGRLVVGVLAFGLAGLLAALVHLAPATLALPFPWERADRGAFERNQREALFNKIDGAAKTAFLRDGRFPDRLSQLRDAGLLSPDDLLDPHGEPLQYTAREDSYTLQATAGGKPLPDADASDSIAGNFLLDPTLLQNKTATGPPIVLLD